MARTLGPYYGVFRHVVAAMLASGLDSIDKPLSLRMSSNDARGTTET